MARAKKNEVKKLVEVKVQQDPRGIKEESEKGELFFKVVLMVMAVALFGVILYFVIDAIIGKPNTSVTKRYEANNYVVLGDVDRINKGENFENLSHLGLKQVLDSYANVYIFLYAENTDSLTEAQKTRQDLALGVVDQLMELESVETKTINGGTEDEFKYVVLNSDTAIFFLDITDVSNAQWSTLINTNAGQASSANIPALLEIVNGEDLEWYGPWEAAGKNEAAITKLQSVLADLS